MIDRLKYFGFTSPSDEKWFDVVLDDTVVPAPLKSCSGSRPPVFQMLAQHGISIIGPDAIKAFIAEVQALRDFPPKDLFERSGWGVLQFPRQYVLSDGTGFAPPDTAKAPIAFQPARGKCHTAGDLKGWKKGVVKPLKHQPLPLFAILLTFAPMLLRLTDRVNNVAFEYTGPKGTGKSTVQQLAASVIGSPGYGGERAYGITFDDFAASPDQQMAAHADALMIVDGADVYFAGETPARRAGRFKTFLTRIGSRGSNAQGAIGGNQGMMCLISAEAPLSTLNGAGTDVAAASAALLITLRVTPDQSFGVFDSIPDAYSSGSALANAVVAAAGRHHGVAIRGYLDGLVAACATDERALRDQIEADIDHFRVRCGVDCNSGAAVRVADAFALVFIAGKLAKRYRVLPQSVQCLETALICYKRHLAGGTTPPPFGERLETIAALPETLTLDPKAPPLSPAVIEKGSVFLDLSKGRRELMIRAESIETFLPDWGSIRGQHAVSAAVITDNSKHMSVKRALTNGGPRCRVYRFRLPVAPLEGLGLEEAAPDASNNE